MQLIANTNYSKEYITWLKGLGLSDIVAMDVDLIKDETI
jgi:hypothetical protein